MSTTAVELKTYDEIEYFPIVEKLANILCIKTQTTDPLFFRILVTYYLAKVASMMRCNIQTLDRGVIPINLYAINLAQSGHGKGHSTNIMEEEVIGKFRQQFLDVTFEHIAEQHLDNLTSRRVVKYGTEYEEEEAATKKEFADLGPLLFSFDSGTTPALKQTRHKLLMSGIGSLNIEIDEIGSNLLGQSEILTTFLELFDIGKVKAKLIKSTSDNRRNEEIIGRTPANMMLFGTPDKLLDGGKTEDEFESILSTGYARRCVFGYTLGTHHVRRTAEEVLDVLMDTSLDNYIQKISQKLVKLADKINYNNILTMSREVALLVIEYRLQCEIKADNLSSYQHIQRAELSHRYFKCLKMAGTYAWIDGSPEILESHWYNAMKLTEDSGQSFERILDRDPASVKLAKYIAEIRREITHADIIEDLPFFKGSEAHRRDMLKLATQWGYKNNIIIKTTVEDDIEFLRGEALMETDLNKITISYSTHIAQGYRNELVPFEALEKFFLTDGYHWVNHHLLEGHRREENCIKGFDTVVIDVDSGTPINTAKLLLKEYKYMLYTTKRHTKQSHRYRIVFPMTHHLKMNAQEFKEFMENFYDWLPFDVDRQTNQRARKWLCNSKANIINHDGELIDVLPFIPKTKKADERRLLLADQRSLSNLERWFLQKTNTGNRSNQIIRYALMLVDAGMDIEAINDKVLSLNKKLPDSLPEGEILATILVTVSKKIHVRDTA